MAGISKLAVKRAEAAGGAAVDPLPDSGPPADYVWVVDRQERSTSRMTRQNAIRLIQSRAARWPIKGEINEDTGEFADGKRRLLPNEATVQWADKQIKSGAAKATADRPDPRLESLERQVGELGGKMDKLIEAMQFKMGTETPAAPALKEAPARIDWSGKQTCPSCGKEFANMRALKIHKGIKHQ